MCFTLLHEVETLRKHQCLIRKRALSEFSDVVTQVLEIQLPGKKVVNAAAFWNGLRGQKLKKL
jgi:hypothetical protein